MTDKTQSIYEDFYRRKASVQPYIDYQKRYQGTIRESDRVIIDIVLKILPETAAERSRFRLLDIGCSTGNLLRHIRENVPGIELFGGDISDESISEANDDPDLSAITIERMDILDIGHSNRFDIVIANAVLYGFGPEVFEQAIANVAKALRPGGSLVAFDFFHPFEQEIAIVEYHAGHPEGHPIHFRSYGRATAVLEHVGLTDVFFTPFNIPIALPHPGFESIRSYTVDGADGNHLSFRGILFQPWHHLLAKKSGA